MVQLRATDGENAKTILNQVMEEIFGNITLYRADCMDVMRDMPDKAFDLAIVDPPYGIGDKRLTQGGTWVEKYKKGDCAWDKVPPREYFEELFRVSRNQIIWGGNYFELPPTRGFIVWDKISHMPTMAHCEYAWTSFDVNARVIYSHRTNYYCEERIHPTQKPVRLYESVLKYYAKPGDRILDTHLGSGATAIACENAGHVMTGIEIDPDYYAAARRRLNGHQLQQKLF